MGQLGSVFGRLFGTAFCVLLSAAFGDTASAQGVIIPYRSGEVISPEENRRLARWQREHWEEIVKEIDENIEEYNRKWRELYKEKEPERKAYEARLEQYFDAHRIPGFGMYLHANIGEDGLYESARVLWVDKFNNPHYEAEFDANGNVVSEVHITPYGRVMQTIQSHRPPDAQRSPDIETSYDINRNVYVSRVTWADKEGRTRSRLAFNEEGVAYWGVNYGPDGRRTGGFYDERLLPKTREEQRLETVPILRIATQPCEQCRAITERRNELARELNWIALDLNDTAERHWNEGKGHAARPAEYRPDAKRDEPPHQPDGAVGQPPLRMRHEHLLRLWRAFKKEFDAADAEMRECERVCRPSIEASPAIAPNFTVGAFGGFARTPYDGRVTSTALAADESGGLGDTMGFAGFDARLYLRAIGQLGLADQVALYTPNLFLQFQYLHYFNNERRNLFATLHNAITRDTGLSVEEKNALRFLLGATFALRPDLAFSLMAGAQMMRSEITGISRETLGGGAEDQVFRRNRTMWSPYVGVELAYALALGGDVNAQIFLAAGAAWMGDTRVSGNSSNFGFDYDFKVEGGIRPELLFGVRLAW